MDNIISRKKNNVVWQDYTITRAHRESRSFLSNNHRGAVLWLTGLSGAGKSTVANALEYKLHHSEGCLTFILDGDNVRQGLNADLGFTVNDRLENMRRVGEVAKLFIDVGVITMTAFISPLRNERERIKSLFEKQDFIEIYCKCPLEVCESRDVKGLYKRARAKEIPHFTGIDSPYEPPVDPNIMIDTDAQTVEESVDTIIEYLRNQNIINRKEG